jgi:Leucine-rich repeat (LRR) protein
MKKSFIITIFCLMTLCILFGSPPKQENLTQPVKGTVGTISKDFGKVPLYFIANKGQMDERVSYFARTSKYTLWLTKQGLVFDQRVPAKDSVKRRDVSRFCFLNSNPDPRISPIETTSYRVNYFKGRDRSQWYTQIPTSKAVLYENLYKNIDLKVYGIEKEIEYDWVVKPGGDPGEIRFRCEGVKSCTLDEKGDLIVKTALGKLVHKRPTGYQVKEGQKHPVEITFSKPKGLKNTFGFQVSAYDKNYPLVIDPMVIVYTSYLGGNDDDYINGMVVDGSGSVIVAGITMSSDFPVLNGWQETRAGWSDAFVTKFTPDGTGLVFSTLVGGSSGDSAHSIGLDSGGSIYIGGNTGSSDFPTLNAFQETFYGVESDAFVCKISADGSGLIYSSFLGGSGMDSVDEIAINNSGELYTLGSTESWDFPLQNPIDSTFSGYNDLFIAKFSSSGTNLVYSTFLGGSDFEQAGGIAIDNSGCAYVTGMTPSTDFPTVNAFQSTNAGQEEGFLSKISADGSSLVYSTYLGGNTFDWLCDIKVDNTGAAYVTGFSASSNYPTTPSAYQPALLGPDAAVITKLSPSGSSLVYSTFLGGSSGAGANVLGLYNGSVYIAGRTSSYDFLLVDPFKDFFSYYSGLFIAQISPDGSTLDFSSFLSNAEEGNVEDIAVDSSGNLYLVGDTSNNFPAYQGFQNTFGGGSYDGFVTKLIPSQYSRITVTSPNGGEYWIRNSTQDITWTAPDITENVKITLSYYDGYDQYLITIAESTPNTGSYTWTVPNISNNTCSIAIEDPTSHISPDWSDDSFTISSPPAITVFLPNGGEEWYPGTENPILWATEGIIESVSIDYSTDGGNSWIPIAENVPYNDYSWTIPDTPSTNCLVRVTDPELSVTDTSDAVFTIVSIGSITVTSPNGGENWEASTTQNIIWTSTGSIANVMIEYSTDNGNSWNTITASTANSGTYNWTVPNTPSPSCLVKISDTAGPAADTSDGIFTIAAQRTLTLTSPNGGENWEGTTSQNITWTSTGSIANVKIEYSTNNGSSWNTITASTANSGVYNWTVPNTPSTTCLVKISDTAGPAADTSDGVFIIAAFRTITVTAPNGGESWYAGTAYNITWTSTGYIPTVNIYYSLNGTNWFSITNSTPNTGIYSWTIPNTPGDNCLLSVSSISASDTSDSVFTILPPPIEITSPNGGENWSVGSTCNITWMNNAVIDNVSIDYSIDSGNSWIPIVTSIANTGTYSWTVQDTTSTNCLVKVSEAGGAFTDTSDALFTIEPPRIPTAERDALIALYNSTNGDNWTNKTNWRKPGYPTEFNDPGTEPTWYGVTTNAENTHVEKIGLGENNLIGTIPDLSAMSNLSSLNLRINELSGEIPASLNSLTQLTALLLDNNQLSGVIPDMSALNNLDFLSLAGNQLTGPIPAWLNQLTQLRVLWLHGNQLSGSIPDLSNLIDLEILYLGNNNLTGSIPAYLNTLVKLRELSLESAQLSGEIPDLSGLTNLEYLRLGSNSLSGNIPVWLNNMTSLILLSLDHNEFTGTIPYLGDITTLRGLYLNDNQINGELPSWLNNLQDLVQLYLNNTQLSGAITGLNLPQLMFLSLADTQISGNMPTFAGCPNMVSLNLKNNQLEGEIPPELGNLPQLSILNLAYNQMTGPIPLEIGNLTSLYSLILNGNQFTGNLPSTITNLTHPNLMMNISYNALYTDDPQVKDFVDNHHYILTGNLNWTEVQTVAPADVAVGDVTENSVIVSWTPILFQGETGGYRVYYSTTPGSGYTLAGSTSDKSESSFTVGGLDANTLYYFVVETFTDPHTENNNTVVSEYSVEVSTTTLEASTITVNAPNGGESWEVSTNHDITWTSTGNISDVKIVYSTDNGTIWNTIVSSTANNGSYNWTIPNNPSLTCLVKISDITDLASDSSDAVFTIAAQRTLTVTTPNGGENWEGTTAQNITWNSTGSIANVKLEYSTDNGSSWNTITASTANSGTYNWTVPNTPSSSCLVKVSDTAGPAVDTSDAVFTIAAQRTLTVTAPNGGENWEAGTSQNITWTSTGSIANVKLEYSTNNGSSWNTITASSANSGSYNWTVPNTPSTTCLVKVSDTAGPAADTSDGVFTISAERTITVTAPNGGETWEGTTSQNITWSSTGSIANVKLEYSTNNGSSWNTITASTTNSGTYNWTVPNTPSTNCLVKISDTAGPAADTSDAVFTIASQRTLTVIAPNGGQRWFINSTYAITWSSTGSISTVMIEYSTNIGGSWTTITSSTSNTGTYNWTIPNTPSTNCLVRVSDTTGPAADTSNSVFTIDPYPTITVSAPNGGETWIANTTHSITWTYTGTIAAVNLEYSSNNGTSWTSIAGSVSNSGSYNWLIPYISSTNCLVRVSDTATTASDTSNAVFTIELPPSLTVTAPNGGESWRRKSTQTITWTWTGTVGDVKIQYTMDGGSSWTVITSSTANNGSYQWTLPNVSSSKTQCLVKIEAINGSAEDTSDAFFTIKK